MACPGAPDPQCLAYATSTSWVIGSGRSPIHGPDKVARYLLGLLRKVPARSAFRLGRVNSQPGIIVYTNGLPSSITILDIVDRRIQEIDIIVNPEKMTGVPALN